MAGPQRIPKPAEAAPVELVDTGSCHKDPEQGIALCLSGGGYRAMLFHLGTLWRLNDAGYLPKIDRISSVSGGSITAATLGLKWSQLAFDGNGVATGFDEVVNPIRRLAGKTIDVLPSLAGVFPLVTGGDFLPGFYNRHLFHAATLQKLPEKPRFVINAASLQSGVLWRFMKPYMRDYRVGEVKTPDVLLAVAVAASSAFPPLLSPVTIRLKETDFTQKTGMDLQRPPYTTKVVLTDGGVYDNLGLETAWKRYDTILVSDAGADVAPEPRPWHNWPGQAYRVVSLVDRQVRALRKRHLVASYIRYRHLEATGGDLAEAVAMHVARKGAYWGIATEIGGYGLADALPCDKKKTRVLARVPTRLKALKTRTQERLINWGYSICDAALRRYVDKTISAPRSFPYFGGVG